MKKELRRVGIRRFMCNQNEEFLLYFTWSSTVASTLMECSHCQEVFIYDEDSVLYGRSLKEEIVNKNCPVCNESLSETLRKYHFDENSISCNNPTISVSTDSLVEIYNLYS